ncbi:MAG TPA: PSD1 and planctomycete cytochrome C domain-containing protein, partial [Terriglobia bacterium]|nr:PSD1 and planctomycete cytochrome C domain-containing protein [Terriglobia bacterium]
EPDFFANRIRPILAARCYTCHGPDIQQNGLRLDSLEAALKGSATNQVILPGDSTKSPLVRRLYALDRPQMPYGGPPLSTEQIDLIRKWIDAGAPGPDPGGPVIAASKPLKHWSYVKPVRPELPAVKNAAWCRNPIDNFVMAQLEKEGLTPSPEADRPTLIRRLSLDLIGLPPTLQEVDDFVNDQSPDAYDKVVDRLLASPHYGERWARLWLDLSRYADSNGYEKDLLRTAWEYRDWLIRALNQDMSFKEFTIDQIAGDMLPNPTDDQKIATGFNRNTLLNEEGGVDKREARWETLVDRVNATATVWLGSTLGCAQCHNHKFDPFTQKDYYRFLAFFDSNADYKILDFGHGEGHVWEPELELPSPEQAAKSKEYRGEIAKLETVLATSTPQLEAAQVKWEEDLKRDESSFTVLRPTEMKSAGGASLKLLDDGSVLAGGKNPNADTYVLQARTDRTGITGVRIEALSDPSLPEGGPGRDPEGNFFLSDFEVEASPADEAPAGQTAAEAQKVVLKINFKEATANESQDGYNVENLVKKDPGVKGWAIDSTPSSVPIVRAAVLVPEKPFGFEGGTLLTIRLKHEMRHSARNLGRFRLAVATLADPRSVARVPARTRPLLDIPAAQRTAKQQDEIAALYRTLSPALQPTRDQIAKLQQSVKDLGIPVALIMGEKPEFERPSTFVRVRGSFMSPADEVYADVPFALGPLPPGAMPNRLGLAEWLVSEDNPLTARVTVNHYWETIFGRGIVETSEDFGTQGDPPSHPELLDWLATEFMGQGWSMKKIIRLMVTSATYRQSSRITPELEERDPYNKLLARGPRFRVEAEMVRDIALEASGLLSPKIGGPSVYPYQPEGVWDRPYSDE